jgi:hypothetical protein
VILNTASIQLSNGLKTVRVLWEDVREGWDDAVSHDFENTQWLPLKGQVEATLVAIDRLGPILDRALRECS